MARILCCFTQVMNQLPFSLQVHLALTGDASELRVSWKTAGAGYALGFLDALSPPPSLIGMTHVADIDPPRPDLLGADQ